MTHDNRRIFADVIVCIQPAVQACAHFRIRLSAILIGLHKCGGLRRGKICRGSRREVEKHLVKHLNYNPRWQHRKPGLSRTGYSLTYDLTNKGHQARYELTSKWCRHILVLWEQYSWRNGFSKTPTCLGGKSANEFRHMKKMNFLNPRCTKSIHYIGLKFLGAVNLLSYSVRAETLIRNCNNRAR